MDVVIEGKITPDDGIAEIIQTVVDLKNLPNAVLRITSDEGDLQGRIGFGRGGYILGGKINATDETGYPAIRKLLTVENGTYAILDPGRTQMGDVNQTLWINAARVAALLPNLPESPQTLLDGGDPDVIKTTVDKAQYDPMDLKLAQHKNDDVVKDSASASRNFDVGKWRAVKLFFVALLILVATVGVLHYWDSISAALPH